MELTNNQNRRIQNLIDKCKKYNDDSLDIYEVMDTYKCYLNATDEVRKYVYDLVVATLYGDPNPVVYGYARVSTKSQEDNTSLDNQIKILKENGCSQVFYEVCTGATMDRPQFIELEKKLKRGDTLIITKLDRFTRSTEKGIAKIKELAEQAGISQATLAKMKKDGATISSDVLVKICTALDCTVDDIMDIIPTKEG